MDTAGFTHPSPIVVVLTDDNLHPVAMQIGRTLAEAPVARNTGMVVNDDAGIMVRVSPEAKPRALRIISSLLTSLEKRGHIVEETEPDASGRTVVGRWGIRCNGRLETIRLYEQADKLERADPYQRTQWRPSGSFVLEAGNKRWEERRRGPLEEILDKVVLAIEADPPPRRQSPFHADFERQRMEEERRRQEAARVARLREMAERWHDVSRIRAFLDAAGQLVPPEAQTEAFHEWLRWGRAYADGLDPLRRSPIA